MIDLTVKKDTLERTVKRARERNMRLPTFEEMKHPEKMPAKVREGLKKVGLWDVDPLNLHRITWKNEPTPRGGGHGKVNTFEIPSAVSGVPCRIVALVGKWFPTGAHKVGASYACLAPRLVTGQFDPTVHKAAWPSTGNYCRGGAYNSALLGCHSVAILPEEMSRERFEWLKKIAGEVIATPGCESNVKEIYDKCWEIRKTRPDVVIFNQFDEFGNHLWHYEVTGSAIEEAFEGLKRPGQRLAGYVSATGSAGTIAAGDYLKERYAGLKIAAAEALQCPTLLNNGFGGHRIEGIGDKHVPWIHNVRNTDMVIAVDDEDCMRVLRLFNEPVGRAFLKKAGVDAAVVDHLDLVGISGIGNLIAAIKMARHYEFNDRDVIFTVFTDSMELYGSRLGELTAAHGPFDESLARAAHERSLLGLRTDSMEELTHPARKRIHNLKYYTWIEQQGRELKELNAQWSDPDYWARIHAMTPEVDRRIREFNEMTGLA